MEPEIPRKLRMKREAPHTTRADADDLVVAPCDWYGVLANAQDPRRANEHAWKRRARESFDAHRPLERLSLGSVVVPPHDDVEDPQRRRVRAPRAGGESLRDQNEPRACGENRQAPAEPDAEGFPQPSFVQQTGDRRRLASGEKEHIGAFEVRRRTYRYEGSVRR